MIHQPARRSRERRRNITSVRAAKEASRRAESFNKNYPTPSDPAREAAVAVQLLKNKQKNEKSILNPAPQPPVGLEDNDIQEERIAMFTAEGHLNHSIAYTADLAELCNFDEERHIPSMHFQARVRAATPSGQTNAKKPSAWHSVISRTVEPP